jgi:hypothetical protein
MVLTASSPERPALLAEMTGGMLKPLVEQRPSSQFSPMR